MKGTFIMSILQILSQNVNMRILKMIQSDS